MELIRFSDLSRHYGANEVFTGLAGVVREGDRIALVGPNGAGKSSLVRLLTGVDEPDEGTIVRARDSRMGYLAQDAAEGGAQTLGAAFADALERGLAHEWEMRSTLNRFNFAERDLDRPLSEFSGGQRTRALLARTLLEKPDWLVLDEPTNHLDLDTVRWLETFVAQDARAYLIVSHDRYFLETVATQVWELDRGVLSVYEVTPGRAYTQYVEERELRREQQRRDYQTAVTERKRQRAVIDELKTHGSHNYSHVRSREKAFARVDLVDAPRADKRQIGVAFASARRATNGIALEVHGITKAYDETLFQGVNAQFTRGDRVAIVGPNGAGKSTFLRIISGDLAPDAGSVRYGTGLTTASYSQSSIDDLPAGRTASYAVMQMGVTDEEARGLLGRLNLGGDSGDKPVEAFSGGERRRIMLARLMAQRADCLFLDEPTNDLDIPSREALEDVLASYEGALFVVSHDRYLLQRLAERVVAIRDGGMMIVDGDYATYERVQHAASNPPAAAKAQVKADPAKSNRQTTHKSKLDVGRRKRAVAEAEKRVANLDAERAELERRFAAPNLYDDPALVVTLQHELDRVRTASEAAMAQWERAIAASES
ncbi:MAG: ATP-binding cassette domain-containing protein [Candidatus Velthaea sp.]